MAGHYSNAPISQHCPRATWVMPYMHYTGIVLCNVNNDLQGQKPGDYVLFRVEIDCIAVMSACPHDVPPCISGEGGPRDVHYQIFESTS